MGAQLEIGGDLSKLLRTALNLQQLDKQAMVQEMAEALVSSSQYRFQTETAPDGSQWTPSARAEAEGGRTLTDKGHMRDSITYNMLGETVAEIGSNMIYAAIHQFGGTIKPVNGSALKFKIPGVGFVTVKSVSIPQRPYLGMSDSDQATLADITTRRMAAAFEGRPQ